MTIFVSCYTSARPRCYLVARSATSLWLASTRAYERAGCTTGRPPVAGLVWWSHARCAKRGGLIFFLDLRNSIRLARPTNSQGIARDQAAGLLPARTQRHHSGAATWAFRPRGIPADLSVHSGSSRCTTLAPR